MLDWFWQVIGFLAQDSVKTTLTTATTAAGIVGWGWGFWLWYHGRDVATKLSALDEHNRRLVAHNRRLEDHGRRLERKLDLLLDRLRMLPSILANEWKERSTPRIERMGRQEPTEVAPSHGPSTEVRRKELFDLLRRADKNDDYSNLREEVTPNVRPRHPVSASHQQPPGDYSELDSLNFEEPSDLSAAEFIAQRGRLLVENIEREIGGDS